MTTHLPASVALVFVLLLVATPTIVFQFPVTIAFAQDQVLLSDPLNTPLTQQQLQSGQTFWAFGGSAGGLGAPFAFYEDTEGLHIGVQSLAPGTWAGYFAVTPSTGASVAQATITVSSRTIPNGSFVTGLYSQTAIPGINGTFCGAITSGSGTIWQVSQINGNASQASSLVPLWTDISPDQPLTRTCMITMNGDNYLKADLDGVTVYESSSLTLNMPMPFIWFLEVQSSYPDEMVCGTFQDFSAMTDGDPSNVSLTVDSVDLSGSPISGLWTVIQIPGTTVATGFTPLTFSATSGWTYQVSVSSYGSDVFDHWECGSTSAIFTVRPTQTMTLKAYYQTADPPPPSSTVTLTVNSVDLSGNTFGGLWATIQSGGLTVASGFTSLTFNASSGTTYSVTVSNYGSYIFDHWGDGSTSAVVSVTPTQDTTLTAYFQTPTPPPPPPPSSTVTLTVNSVDLSGNPFDGLWTVVQTGGATVASGFTSLTFNASSGTTYTVMVSSYGAYTFDHWNGGSTAVTTSITPTQNSTLTAYFQTPTPPPPPPPSSAALLTINTVNMTGIAFDGLWVTIQTGGVTVASGFSSLQFNATVGTTYAVTVSNYGSYIFDHWGDGSTSATFTLTPTQATTLVAYYQTP